MSKGLRYGLIALLALVATVSSVGQAAAQEERPLQGRRTVRGPIVTIDDDTLTIELQLGNVTILTNDETAVHIIGQENSSLSDLAVGDVVVVHGRREGERTGLARVIILQPEGDHASGRVASLVESGLTLRLNEEAELSIVTGPDTVVVLNGRELPWAVDPAPADLMREGMLLVAFGEMSADGTSLEAHTLVWPRIRPRPQAAAGHITSIDGDELTIATLSGHELRVITGDETRFRLPGVDSPQLSDFGEGDLVAVAGLQLFEGPVRARMVAAVPEDRPQGRPAVGEIEEINGVEIRVKRFNGQSVTIVTTAETIYRVGDRVDASLADFGVGDRIALFGSREPGTDRYLATHVMKRG